jgi:hypothetical protein
MCRDTKEKQVFRLEVKRKAGEKVGRGDIGIGLIDHTPPQYMCDQNI